jgi:hypothetical protein
MADGSKPSVVDAVAYALVHATAGLALGTALQAAVPPLTELESLSDTAAMAAVQAVANGIAVFGASRMLDRHNDPTAGILFIWALMITQKTLTERMRRLGGELQGTLAPLLLPLLPGSADAADAAGGCE